MKNGADTNLNLVIAESEQEMPKEHVDRIADIVIGLFIKRFFKKNGNQCMRMNEEKPNVHLADL